MSMLKCGAAVRDVTPPLGLNIPQCMSLNLSVGIKDRLYTHAIAFEYDGKKAIIISVDTSGLGASFAKSVRREISERTDVAPEAIMVSAIHIHTGGPQLMDVFWGQKEDKGVTEFFLKQTVEASIEALDSMKEVKAYFSTCCEDRFSFCRNYLMKDGSIVMNPGRRSAENIVRPVAEIDYSLTSLRFIDLCGDPVAEIVNFACHPDTVGGREYSSDYPGELRRAIKEVYGENYTVLFLNGFSGNVNHIDAKRFTDPDFRYPKDHYKIMGKALAQKLLENREIDEELKPDLSYAQKRFLAPRRQPTDAEVENAEKTLVDENTSGVAKSLAREILKLKKHPRKNELVEIQVIKIADVCVVGFPGEPFSDIGLEIRKKNPDVKLIFSELANNELGYLATEPAFSAGVYEAVLPSDPFELDVIDKMIDTSIMLINKIK